MFKFIKNLNRKNRTQKYLKALHDEIEKNWEAWHVMHQRNVLDRFALDAWQECKNHQIQLSDEKIREYVNEFEEYNRMMDDFKSYELWYSGNPELKTKMNAQHLHAKKEAVSQKFKGMLVFVEQARDIIRSQMSEESESTG